MATITTRAGKGTPLTNTEVDDNFTNLNTDKAELSGATFTGNVGIGASPDTLLHVHGAGSGNGTYGAQITIGKNNGCKISSTQESADDDVQGLAFFTKSSNQLSDSAVERLRIDESGNVGIGTTSPACHLNVSGSGNGSVSEHVRITSTDTDSKLAFVNTTGNSAIVQSGQDMRFMNNTANTERMRIDSSGNLLVGTTDNTLFNNTTGGGANILADGLTTIARQTASTTDTVFVLNDTGAGGTMQEFRVDGTTVGSIGTKDGDIYLGTGDTGLRFYDDGNEVYPAQASDGAGRDAAVDLGSTSKRFKDLRLSGTAYVGSVLIGTTAATPNAKLKVNGAAILNDSVIYSKAYSTLDTTGHVVAKATGGTNGKSTTFIFTGQGGGAAPFHIVFACINAGGQWSATRSEIAASSSVDVVASTSGNDVLFTFKSKSGTQSYSPKVKIETVGSNYDTAYLAA